MITNRKKFRRRLNRIAAVVTLVIVISYVAQLGWQPEKKSSNFNIGTTLATNNLPIREIKQFSYKKFDSNGRLSLSLAAPAAKLITNYNQQTMPDTVNQKTSFEEIEEINFDLVKKDTLAQGLESISYPDSNSNVMVQKPLIFAFNNSSEKDIELTAETANINLKNNLALLQGNVRLIGIKKQSLMETETLSLDFLEKFAFTDKPVTLLNSNTKSTAKGMHGSLIEQRWQLLNNVKSTIMP